MLLLCAVQHHSLCPLAVFFLCRKPAAYVPLSLVALEDLFNLQIQRRISLPQSVGYVFVYGSYNPERFSPPARVKAPPRRVYFQKPVKLYETNLFTASRKDEMRKLINFKAGEHTIFFDV